MVLRRLTLIGVWHLSLIFFFFQAEDGIRDVAVTGVSDVCSSDLIVGVEALIRWQSPELGLVPPLQFIPLLEETGLIQQVGSWALKRASLDHRSWVKQGIKAPRVAVNVSPIQLRQRIFVEVIEHAIMEGIAPTAIDLEITESLIMEDIEANIAKLNAVRGLGIKIAIDDFGTGYSSLGYLAKLPVQSLKIDRSFISAMHKDTNDKRAVDLERLYRQLRQVAKR